MGKSTRSKRREMKSTPRSRKVKKEAATKRPQVARRMLKVTKTKLKAERMERPKTGTRGRMVEMKKPRTGSIKTLELWQGKNLRLET